MPKTSIHRSPTDQRPALALRCLSLLAVSLAACAFVPATAVAAERTSSAEPTNDAMLLTAGFLEHHQDIKYRLLGMKAYGERNYEDALRFFRRASFFADKPSQGMVGEMYWNGQGVARDPVQAYVWMDLAAERGYRGFIGMREKYWNALSEAERSRVLAEGQDVYARYGDDAAKPRYEFKLRQGRREMTGSRVGFNRGVSIELPGPAGQQAIEGSQFYDERYWDAKKYWAWQDKHWMKPKIGKVTIGEFETTSIGKASRIPQTAPQIDAAAPEVKDEPAAPVTSAPSSPPKL